MIPLHVREFAVAIATNVHRPGVKGAPGDMMMFAASWIVFAAEWTEERVQSRVGRLDARAAGFAVAIATKNNCVAVCA
jgi:hypothetical protein